jgi:translocation and assembly module TamB
LFIGTPDLNPTVQVTAEYEVKEATNVTNIRVLVGGTVKKPRISLESDAQPPLSQSDLLSYLAFGRSSGSLLQIGSTGTLGGGGLRGGSVVNAASSRLAGVAMGVAVDEFEGDAARSLGMDVFNVTPGELPVSTIETGFSQFIRGTEIEMGRYLSPSTFVSAVTTPGIVACLGGRGENSACSTPGLTLQYRTNKGYRFETSLTPRYILNSPTLAGQTAGSTSQFGAFVIREWRF